MNPDLFCFLTGAKLNNILPTPSQQGFNWYSNNSSQLLKEIQLAGLFSWIASVLPSETVIEIWKTWD